MKYWIVLIGLLFYGASLSAQSIFGKWVTIDDNTGEHKSTVEIYEENGLVYGKIVDITREDRRDNLCVKCKGADKDKPVLGLKIIKGLKSEDNTYYEKGTITDPENGKTYKAKIWVDEDNPDILNVRGYISFLYRTQNWQRVK